MIKLMLSAGQHYQITSEKDMMTARRNLFSNMLRLVLSLCVCISFALMAVVIANAQQDKSDPIFEVKVAIDQESLKTEFYKKTGMFQVYTKVKNISHKDQKLVVWTQYGWSWLSDNPEVQPMIAAKKNSPSSITIAPGQEYESTLEMHTTAQLTGPVTFRLGFVPRTKSPVSTRKDKIKSKDIAWSNPVVLDPMN